MATKASTNDKKGKATSKGLPDFHYGLEMLDIYKFSQSDLKEVDRAIRNVRNKEGDEPNIAFWHDFINAVYREQDPWIKAPRDAEYDKYALLNLKIEDADNPTEQHKVPQSIRDAIRRDKKMPMLQAILDTMQANFLTPRTIIRRRAFEAEVEIEYNRRREPDKIDLDRCKNKPDCKTVYSTTFGFKRYLYPNKLISSKPGEEEVKSVFSEGNYPQKEELLAMLQSFAFPQKPQPLLLRELLEWICEKSLIKLTCSDNLAYVSAENIEEKPTLFEVLEHISSELNTVWDWTGKSEILLQAKEISECHFCDDFITQG